MLAKSSLKCHLEHPSVCLKAVLFVLGVSASLLHDVLAPFSGSGRQLLHLVQLQQLLPISHFSKDGILSIFLAS